MLTIFYGIYLSNKLKPSEQTLLAVTYLVPNAYGPKTFGPPQLVPNWLVPLDKRSPTNLVPKKSAQKMPRVFPNCIFGGKIPQRDEKIEEKLEEI